MKKIHIQSITDIITNSSTEVFIVIDTNTVKSIKEIAEGFGIDTSKYEFILDYVEAVAQSYMKKEDIDAMSEKLVQIDGRMNSLSLATFFRGFVGKWSAEKYLERKGYSDEDLKEHVYDLSDAYDIVNKGCSWLVNSTSTFEPDAVRPKLVVKALEGGDEKIAALMQKIPTMFEAADYCND